MPRSALTQVELGLLEGLKVAGVTDPTEQAMFLAQVAHESNGFAHVRENLNYSAERLLKVFPKKFKDPADARAVAAGGESAIAERIYGNRKDLRNINDGDGALYRGRGYIQLTGRFNYEQAGKALKVDLLNHPELAEEPAMASRIAVWFWMKDSVLRSNAQHGDVETATRRINGGLIGLADRRARFREYQHLLDLANSGPPLP